MKEKEVPSVDWHPSTWDVIELHSEWVGDSQFRIRVSQLKEHKTSFKVDVFELSNGRMADKRCAERFANRYMRRYGALIALSPATVLCDFRADRKSEKLDGTQVLVKRRHCSYLYSGVENVKPNRFV